ncbi:MAG: SPOR domain-containing protein [Marinilabilia sp.]
MEQYLLELIKNNNRVIVPNFGAFIVSRDAGTTVLFNNFLSFNDGLLINHVSTQEGIDTHEATRRVSDFVEKIKQDLEENGEYAIEKLGRFTKDQNGILRFTQDPHVSELLPDENPAKQSRDTNEDSTLLDIDSEDKIEKTPEKKSTSKTEPAQGKKDITGSKSKTAGKPAEKALGETKKTPAAEKKAPPTEKKTPAAEKKTPPAGKTKQPYGSGNKPPVSPPPRQTRERKSGFPGWAIALLIIIPIALIILYFLLWRGDNDQQPKMTEDETSITDTVEEKPTIDSAAIKEAREEEKRLQEEEQQKAKEQEASAKPKHHLIVGSFENENNAKNLVKELKNKGFDSATSFKHNNLIMVSAASFESLTKARDTQQKIVEEQRMENWILTRR